MAQYANGGPAWALCEANAPGATLCQEEPLPPEGTYRVIGYFLFDREGEPILQWNWVEWSLEDAKTQARADLEVAYQARMEVGFAHDFGGGVEHLQVSRTEDQVRWLGFKDACEDQIAAGFGAAPVAIPIRSFENITHTVTADSGRALMIALRGWMATQLAWTWAMKDHIETLTTHEQFAALDFGG